MLLLAACFGACVCKSGTADIHDLYGMGAFKQHVSHRPHSTFETEHLFQARDDWRRERERERGGEEERCVCVCGADEMFHVAVQLRESQLERTCSCC